MHLIFPTVTTKNGMELATRVVQADPEDSDYRKLLGAARFQNGDFQGAIAELEKAIKQTKAQFAYSSESVTHQGYWLGFSQVVASLTWLDRWLEQLTAVTAQDVQRVAQTYFTPNRQTVGWYIPE